jgi:hypothetical protein
MVLTPVGVLVESITAVTEYGASEMVNLLLSTFTVPDFKRILCMRYKCFRLFPDFSVYMFYMRSGNSKVLQVNSGAICGRRGSVYGNIVIESLAVLTEE